MAEPYIAFSREAEEARRRFRDFRNKQSLNPVSGMGLDPAMAGAAREARALEGGRLQDIRRDLTRANVRAQSDAGLFAPGENQPTGIDPALTSRVRASVQAQKALDPLPPSPQQFMDAAQGRGMGMTPNEFARMKVLRDSGTDAGAPYKISEAAFRGGADEMAKMAAERAGQPTDREAARLRLVAETPPMPAAPAQSTQAEQLRMAAVKQQDREAGKYGADALAKYDAEKAGERDAARRLRELPLREGELRLKAAEQELGLSPKPANTVEALGEKAIIDRVKALGGEPSKVANLDREYSQIAADLGSSFPIIGAIADRIKKVIGSVPEAARASEARRLLEVLDNARAFDRSVIGVLNDTLNPDPGTGYKGQFEELRKMLESMANGGS